MYINCRSRDSGRNEDIKDTAAIFVMADPAADAGTTTVPALDARDLGFEEEEDALGAEIAAMSTEDIIRRSKLIDNEIRVLKVSCTSFFFAFSEAQYRIYITPYLHTPLHTLV